MKPAASLDSSTNSVTLLGIAMLSLSLAAAAAAVMPLSSATVTRVENKVSYGKVKGGKSQTRPANAQDVIRASDFLLSETESRAELKYEDGSIVRVGQNTVFTFDANTRTLSLEKGTLVFFIPKGSGGGTIKTPSLTAAITGTVGKVSVNTIAILIGSATVSARDGTVIPGDGVVGENQFARKTADGPVIIRGFDPAKANDGNLMSFNGPMPGMLATETGAPALSLTDLQQLESRDRVQNSPSGMEHFFPAVIEKTRTPVPQPPRTTESTPPPGY